ncbi:MAG TPA: hypothetical protein DCE52_19430 [Rhodobacteraceae bacterium]|nr:hypothetical protein [Paracoccaceae bacterium]
MNTNENTNENNTWYCCDPCAIIVILLSSFPSKFCMEPGELNMMLHTLDNHGWLDEDGKMDLPAASKELARAKKLSQQN